MSGCKFEIHRISEHNDELLATAPIKAMELIFAERPFLWCPQPSDDPTSVHQTYCYHCGAGVDNMSLLFKAYMQTVRHDEVSTANILQILDVHCHTQAPDDSQQLICEGCGCRYCSPGCHEASVAAGHKHICGHENFENNGHNSLALKAYGLIVQTALDNRISSIESYRLLFKWYHAEPFTATKHAFRTGSIYTVTTPLFTEMIAPAYFEANLRSTMDTLKVIFSTSEYISNKELGIDDILQDAFLDSLVGTFVVNNVTFSIPSPLTSLQKEGVVVKTFDEGNSLVSNADSFYRMNFPALSCTALFPTLAKTNHECNSTTFISPGSEGYAQIKVHASRDIDRGGIITNSYLHKVPGDIVMTKTERKRALCQYLFECSCPICESQNSEDDESNDDE